MSTPIKVGRGNGLLVTSAHLDLSGFKTLNQAQLLSDALYYASGNDSQAWLIYYVSRPLLGSFELVKVIPAALPGRSAVTNDVKVDEERGGNSTTLRKQDIRSFEELLSNFPMIARQMQPGLERLFREFGKELGKPLPPPPSQSPSFSAGDEDKRFMESTSVRSPSPARIRLPFNSEEYFEDDEDLMRRSLETAVTAAIDLFRLVDKQQLSLLGATTDLTGPVVERLIERYVAEQVHESLLFPRLCSFRQVEDVELDSRIRQLENIDVSQVGIVIDGGRKGKQEFLQRLGKAVEEFRKMSDAKCPQDMLEALLATVRAVTMQDRYGQTESSAAEKQASNMTVNADVLVSLLLIVVIRSQIRHLQARLLYMQHFIYVDDVESGEMGYALSTFEAVLTYLTRDSSGLRKASAWNKRLWNSTKAGKVSEMKSVLEPPEDSTSVDASPRDVDKKSIISDRNESCESEELSVKFSSDNELFLGPIAESQQHGLLDERPPLAHVFPFQTWMENLHPKASVRSAKKVSMDVSSLSGSSAISQVSRTTTIASMLGGDESDISVETLTETQDPAGDSVPMMAVESRQPEALKYLLSLRQFYPFKVILEDTNSDGTTLLSAAVQLAQTELVDIIVDFMYQEADTSTIATYLSKSDIRGRTVAHYLFSAPYLMSRLGNILPWRQKDKHGQTPLFALCRSYDHPDYSGMVNEALTVAQKAQGDHKPLRLDDHVDSKGNTLLHIVGDPQITGRILRESDCDPNATNDKQFTPLMMASKYGRVDQMRTLFADPRVDVHIKEARGLTAVELAKDDEVRNKIDDLILFLNPPSNAFDMSGRITTVVRSFFVEDATVRFIIKSGAPSQFSSPASAKSRPGSMTYTVTTCRRTVADFENLAKWLAVEQPASYIPNISDCRNPFQIHSKPSRSVLHDLQEKLDRFLKILLAHPTFGTHEMLWEFFLVPELQPEMMEDRCRRKASVLFESIYDDYEPVAPEGIGDTEQIISHAQEMVRGVHANSQSVIRRGHAFQHAASDFADAVALCSSMLSSFDEPTNTLPRSHLDSFARYAAAVSTSNSDSSALTQYLTTITAVQSTTAAILESLSRPAKLISALGTTNRNISRSRSTLISSSLPRKFNINLPGLEESRQKNIRELEHKIRESEAQASRTGREITWNKDVVVGELAGWTTWREGTGRDAIRSFAKATLIREKERLRKLELCLRSVGGDLENQQAEVSSIRKAGKE